jgi:hypothetical protein
MSERDLRAVVDRRLRRALPRPAYQVAIGRYYGLRKVVGKNHGRGRLLPDFVIIGAAKAGTTSLYGWLSKHPYVAPASQKEVHYFDYNSYRGLDWYRQHFPLERERAEFASEHGRPFVTGEASPSYISHDWAPQRAARALPGAKLLVMLRNPIDRAYSQYQMSRREREEPLESFIEAVDRRQQGWSRSSPEHGSIGGTTAGRSVAGPTSCAAATQNSSSDGSRSSRAISSFS